MSPFRSYIELGVMPEIVEATEEMDWILPTNIQAEAIPLILGGGDVLMAAETGSGKTGAFCLPVIQIVHEALTETVKGKPLKSSVKPSIDTKVKLNPFDRSDQLAIDKDGLICQGREHFQWLGCRSNIGVVKGKFYYEATVTDEGLCRVGWSTDIASLDLGTDNNGFGFGGTGKKSYARQFDGYGEPFGHKDVIGCMLDLDNYEIRFSKNGVDFGRAFEIPQKLRNSPFFAAVVLKNAEMQFNFGDDAFTFSPPQGFRTLSKSTTDERYHNIKGPNSSSKESRRPTHSAPTALIIEPSRELAQQTCDQISLFKEHLASPAIREVLLVGGENPKQQVNLLREGVEMVVGTPGRLDDFISSKKLDLSQVRFYILDEVDGLLAQGHSELICQIYNKLPKVSTDGKRLQIIVCSATLHNEAVKQLADKIMKYPTWIDLKGKDSVPDTVHHVVCMIDPTKDKGWLNLRRDITTDKVHANDLIKSTSTTPETLSEAIKTLKVHYLVKAINALNMEQAIIFCRTKLDCDNIEKHLIELGGGPRAMVNQLSCVCLHSDRNRAERQQNLSSFKCGQIRFLICTDVAARGLDITGIPYVVNVTLPDEKENYIHRIGRVGRADRMGLAISLISTVPEKVWYHTCPSRGKKCHNTKLKENGGCTIWYDEVQLLKNVENHLNTKVATVNSDFVVEKTVSGEKIVYGGKKSETGENKGHFEQLASTVSELATLEKQVQLSFLSMQFNRR
ncbi:uncharacterized protein TRIADDRAFT_24752 [Trichoplax adhaerens]|uniref:ATP-dependent RNA helicase n=1 Tax=Trichoplax adhaerens TaxID=10228 RepID=B3RV64_TRIAD|nr:hypothetical protein TRIADDRAFT_24752 [Trichoplax adhaerens]EDV25940.1 hypothetical protein TRIADDRAFT_24752 [Trichoplax adhaerens]|eukprot:XP_002111973.1 hypothetical protein TRIADDRAFT_24752 [Trichoplax adhaerens]